jgi:citronellol/citronellal dehydrogenase
MASIFKAGLFRDQVAIVTGGATGIGFATARSLLELGARVAICGRNSEKLELARAQLVSVAKRATPDRKGDSVYVAPCDIREASQIDAFVAGAAATLGAPSILVNNAGGQFPTSAELLANKGWDAVIRNNLNGTFYMTKAVATAHLIPNRRGRVVNVIANIARGFPGMVHTGAARAGVENLTKTLAVEWACHNVQVNAVAPGIIRTTGVDQYPPELVELSRQRTPAKRLGTAEEVAELVAYLASDAAWFVTGATWYIDGGAHLWGDNWQIPDAPNFAEPRGLADLLNHETNDALEAP